MHTLLILADYVTSANDSGMRRAEISAHSTAEMKLCDCELLVLIVHHCAQAAW